MHSKKVDLAKAHYGVIPVYQSASGSFYVFLSNFYLFRSDRLSRSVTLDKCDRDRKLNGRKFMKFTKLAPFLAKKNVQFLLYMKNFDDIQRQNSTYIEK